MIAHEQCAALGWNVIKAHYANAIDGAGEKPKHEPQHRVRQKPEDINRACEREDAAHKKNGARGQLQALRQQPVSAGGKKHSDEGEEVGRCLHFAFCFS